MTKLKADLASIFPNAKKFKSKHEFFDGRNKLDQTIREYLKFCKPSLSTDGERIKTDALLKFRYWFRSSGKRWINSETIDAYKNHLNLTYNGGGPSLYYVQLKGFFKWLTRNKLISEDPTKDSYVKIRHQYVKQPYVTQNEYNKLKSELNGADRLAIIIAWNTGLRLSDVISLKWREIDWNKMLLIKQPQKTKNRYSTEVRIPLDPNTELGQTLMELREDASSEYVINGKVRAHDKIRAIVPNRSFHGLRRSFLTRVANSVDTLTAMQLAGIRSLDTVKRYITINDKTLRNAIEKANDFSL